MSWDHNVYYFVLAVCGNHKCGYIEYACFVYNVSVLKSNVLCVKAHKEIMSV